MGYRLNEWRYIERMRQLERKVHSRENVWALRPNLKILQKELPALLNLESMEND